MSLIVENGSIVDNANSLVTRAEFIAYASLIGTTIVDDEDADVLLIKAMKFIDAHESKLKGIKTERDQSLSFPRYNLRINGWSWNTDEIPTEAKDCQMELALELNSGTDLYNPTFSKGPRIEETVSGAVTVRYGTNSVSATRLTSKGFKLLDSLLKTSGITSIPLVRA